MKLFIFASFFISLETYAQSCTQLKECLHIASKLTGHTFLIDKGVVDNNPRVKGRLFNPSNAESHMIEILIESNLALQATGTPKLSKIIATKSGVEARDLLQKWREAKK